MFASVIACGATTPADPPATASGPSTPAPPEGSPAGESGSSTGSRPDAGDASPPSPEPDAATDASTADAATCGYEAAEQWVVDCANVPKKVTQLDSATCPDAYALGGAKYASLSQALAAQSCNPACVRKAFQAVMLLRCGKKTEFITYRAEGCTDVIDTPDGLFRSVEEWNAAKPCP